MDWNQIETGWLKMKEAAHSRWSRLTDKDLEVIGGEKALLIRRIQELYGFSREEAELEIERWRDGLKLADDHSRLQDEIERLKSEAAKFAKNAGDELRDGAEQASAKASEFAKELESAIERNPLQAALIAAGLGLLIGLLTRPNR